jgi:hypothetical protein
VAPGLEAADATAGLAEDADDRRCCLAARRSRLPPTWELRDAAMRRERRLWAGLDEGREARSDREALQVTAIVMAAPLLCLAWAG